MPSTLIRFSSFDVITTLRKLTAVWVSEVGAALPEKWVRALSIAPRCLVVVLLDEGFEVRTASSAAGGSLALLFQGGWDGALDFVRSESRRWGALLTVTVAVPASRCLIRKKELPLGALQNVRPLLRMDMELATPFKEEQVYWGWASTPSATGRAHILQYVVKRDRIDAVVADLNAIDVQVGRVEALQPEGHRSVEFTRNKHDVPAFERALRLAILCSATALFFAIAVLAGLSFYWQSNAADRLQSEIAALTTRAHEVAKRRAGEDRARAAVHGLYERRNNEPRSVELWEEITRRLPDSAWITDFKYELGNLTLEGFSPSASELLPSLAQSPLLTEVAFSSPTTRDPQSGFERFQLRLRAVTNRSSAPAKSR